MKPEHAIIDKANPWNGPYIIRIWDDASGKVASRSRTESMDLSGAIERWGQPVGTSFGTSLDVWIEMPDVAIMVYPLFPHERGDMDLVKRAMEFAGKWERRFWANNAGVATPEMGAFGSF